MTLAKLEMTIQQENELICERLLGWKRHQISERWWKLPEGQKFADGFDTTDETPTFRTWAEAGLIVEALEKARVSLSHNIEAPLSIQITRRSWGGPWDVRILTPERCIARGEGNIVPDAVRSAALTYAQTLG